jgi:hypothetical protein
VNMVLVETLTVMVSLNCEFKIIISLNPYFNFSLHGLKDLQNH